MICLNKSCNFYDIAVHSAISPSRLSEFVGFRNLEIDYLC